MTMTKDMAHHAPLADLLADDPAAIMTATQASARLS
jgi:hypothetical protein